MARLFLNALMANAEHSMKDRLKKYKAAVDAELKDILIYWMENTVDLEHGGFIGRIAHTNEKDFAAPKGSVLNSRILWSFSAAYNHTHNIAYLQTAQRAFAYFLKHVVDKDYGGVFWSVTADGEPLNTKKQIYALAFGVYGLSEYCIASGDEDAKENAVRLYREIVKYSYDKSHGGYIEALNRDWQAADDLRLSEKDAAERKSMNTHLHVLEAFAALYRIWPDEELKEKLAELLRLFAERIINGKTNHLSLFFSDDWQVKSGLYSYGHDIEAAWLLQDAAEVLGDVEYVEKTKVFAIKLADAAAEGLDRDGGLWHEYDADKKGLVKEKHWWPQAEAMVGFFNAWQNTGEEKWLTHSLNSWDFVQQFIKDKSGEWLWGVYGDQSPMIGEDKVGLWKCPYHNSRACIEISRRLEKILNETPAGNLQQKIFVASEK